MLAAPSPTAPPHGRGDHARQIRLMHLTAIEVLLDRADAVDLETLHRVLDASVPAQPGAARELMSALVELVASEHSLAAANERTVRWTVRRLNSLRR